MMMCALAMDMMPWDVSEHVGDNDDMACMSCDVRVATSVAGMYAVKVYDRSADQQPSLAK